MDPIARLNIPLDTTPEQNARLAALQVTFAAACNWLAPRVQSTRIWNRVTLHHLYYRQLRTEFPALGSQMACNAIYSVSRTCRLVFQNPASPFNLARLGDRPLPMLRFTDRAPVYFDRHTLSVRAGRLSMFTLDGRIRFLLSLRPADEAALRDGKLREISLSRRGEGVYQLSFLFGAVAELPGSSREASTSEPVQAPIPEYVLVENPA